MVRDGHSRSFVSLLFNFILFDKKAIWVGTSILLWGVGKLMEFSTHWQVFCKAGSTVVKNRGSGLR